MLTHGERSGIVPGRRLKRTSHSGNRVPTKIMIFEPSKSPLATRSSDHYTSVGGGYSAGRVRPGPIGQYLEAWAAGQDML